MSEYFIHAKDLTYSYTDDEGGRQQVLRGISLDIGHGEYVAILGHNGSGKSTLAKLFNMILVADGGELVVAGKSLTDENMSEDDLFQLRREVGMVFQNPDNQLVATVVEEDVAFGPENLGVPSEEIRRRVDEALALVGMTEYSRHAPHKLSGGQKQRVAIAGIIAMKPRVIIFDESTAMLDPLGRRAVVDIMERLNREENITVINITHYMDEAARADRVIVINDGVLMLDGSAKEVFSDVDKLHEMGLEAPQGRELIAKLQKLGYDISDNALSEEECIDALTAFLKR